MTSVCYCVGAGEDISFDLQLINRFGCSVYTFDPTPKANRHFELLRNNTFLNKTTFINGVGSEDYQCDASTLSRLHFFPYGLWSETKTMRFYAPKDPSHVSHSLVNLQRTQEYFEADCRTVKQVMSDLNHSRITLLKLDVEGAEYKIIDSMLADAIFPIILCVEFDEGRNPQDSAYLDRVNSTIKKLKEAGYLATFFDTWNVTFVKHDLPTRS
jgi:FkbM family methyltransferase